MRPRIFAARILGFRLHLLRQREWDERVRPRILGFHLHLLRQREWDREAESMREADGVRHESVREADGERHKGRVSESGRGEWVEERNERRLWSLKRLCVRWGILVRVITYIYIYITRSGRVRVRAGFLKKPWPVSGFFFKNPNSTLFLIGPGKIWSIRVWLGRVSAGWAKIATPNSLPFFPISRGMKIWGFKGIERNEYSILSIQFPPT